MGVFEFVGEVANDAVPCERFSGGACGAAYGRPVLGLVECVFEALHEGEFVVEGSGVAVFAVAYVAAWGGVVVGEGDESGGHGFGDDIAKGFGDTGEDEEVA